MISKTCPFVCKIVYILDRLSHIIRPVKRELYYNIIDSNEDHKQTSISVDLEICQIRLRIYGEHGKEWFV